MSPTTLVSNNIRSTPEGGEGEEERVNYGESGVSEVPSFVCRRSHRTLPFCTWKKPSPQVPLGLTPFTILPHPWTLFGEKKVVVGGS